MPTIKPTDANDCVQFINQYRDEIVRGVYDIQIEKDWVNAISNTELLFLIQHCRRPVETIALTATAENILEILARSNNFRIRRAVAENEHTSARLLEHLACDSDMYVRRCIVRHANTTLHILEILAKDADDDVRRLVAGDKRTPASLLEILGKDSDKSIRMTVAENPNT
ncbi:MAG TPA: hypothetical protein VD861_08460, partial [Pyrinomonadaceae bacterium]|nr:hypothetical protein [Pyrinomonadaceae bacterium]